MLAIWDGESQTVSPLQLWSDIEQDHHINVLELKAVYIGIVTLCKGHSFKHVKAMCDNTTAVAYIKKKRRY